MITTKLGVSLLCSFVFLLAVASGYARESAQVTTCILQEKADTFLNTVVEVRATIIEGSGHSAFIHDGQCKFLVALGADYQTFGKRFPAKQNAEWKRMQQVLSKSECANNVRVVKAKFRGTVIRIPATGIIPPDEMGIELVIQSVADVERVPVKCTPPTESR